MNSEVVVADELKVNDLCLLILVDPLGDNPSSLSVSLSPLFGLGVVERKADDTLAELVHDVGPKHVVNLMVFDAE